MEQERIQKAEEAAKIDELPARLAFNDQWNWKNTFTRRQALKDIKYQTKEQEYFTRVRMNKENLDTQRQAYDKVKGYWGGYVRILILLLFGC